MTQRQQENLYFEQVVDTLSEQSPSEAESLGYIINKLFVRQCFLLSTVPNFIMIMFTIRC